MNNTTRARERVRFKVNVGETHEYYRSTRRREFRLEFGLAAQAWQMQFRQSLARYPGGKPFRPDAWRGIDAILQGRRVSAVTSWELPDSTEVRGPSPVLHG
jgi:hypothetical protein